MSTSRNVAVVVGSLRKESFNRKMANALIAMAPQPLALKIVEITNPNVNGASDFSAAGIERRREAGYQAAAAKLDETV